MPVGRGSTVSLVLGPRLPNMGNGSDSSRRGEPRRSAEAITPRSITGVAQLIPAAAEGDAAALGELLAALLPIAERYTRPFLASRRDGYDAHQDLLQEWTVRVLRALPNCRATEDEQLVDWALAIARRTVAQFYRTEWSHMSGREDIADCSIDVYGQATPEDETDPESELRLALREAYANLSTSAAEICWMRLVQGASWEEVGVAFGTTTSGAKRRFQRALGRLRHRIDNRLIWPP
jgi:RNA polymerase sigma-70 factor (ECF subfamily)